MIVNRFLQHVKFLLLFFSGIFIANLACPAQVWNVSTLAGNNGFYDSVGTQAQFNTLYSIVVKDTLLYVADEQNKAIRQVSTLAGVTRTLLRNVGNVRAICLSPSRDTLFFVENRATDSRLNRYIFQSQTVEELVVLPDPNITSIVMDRERSVFAASFSTHRIIKIDKYLVITSYAGRRSVPGNELGIDTIARFRGIRGLALSRTTDTLYVADSDNNQIKRIAKSTRIVSSLIANNFLSPRGLTLSRNFDTLFVASHGVHTINWIRLRGNPTSGAVAGSANNPGLNNSPSPVRFNGPNYLVVAPNGFLYLTDFGNNCIRRLNRARFTTTLAGGSLLTNGVGVAARLNFPSEIVKHPRKDTIYFTDFNNQCIRQVDLRSGLVSTVTGNGTFGFADGNATAARFHGPVGLVISATGDSLFVSEQFNNRIRMVLTRTRVTRTVAGRSSGYRDGRDTASRFNRPVAMVKLNDAIYIADANNHRIRKMRLDTFYVTTVAGSGVSGFKDTTSLLHARFSGPTGITTDGKYLFVGDANNQRIRKIDLDSGKVTTLAGSGLFGFIDGAPNVARFRNPQKLSYDGKRYLWIGGFANDAPLRRVDVRTGFTKTVTNNSGFVNGPIQTAAFFGPQGACFDTLNNLVYLAEAGNNAIRRIEIFINESPSFTINADTVSVLEDSAAFALDTFATAISAGISPVELAQSLTFELTPDRPNLFAEGPALDSSGRLSFVPAADSNGIVRVKVVLRDNGGTSDNGIDTLVQYFAIRIIPVNDPPSMVHDDKIQVLPSLAPVSLNFATSLITGPPDETGQTLSFTYTLSNPQMFSVAPTLDLAGNLRFTLATTNIDSSEVNICLRDNGGIENGGVDTACYPFRIVATTMIAVKDILASTRMKAYPNPVQDKLYLTGLQTNVTYSLVHATGKQLQVGQLKPGQEIQVGHLPSGFYALLIQQPDNSIVRFSFQKQ